MNLKFIKLVCVLTVGASTSIARAAPLVYVTNWKNGTISTVPTGGGTATTFATGLAHPEGIAIDPTGQIYVNNQLSGVIHKVSQTGVLTPFVTIPVTSHTSIGGMKSDATGNLYVSLQTETTNAGGIYKVTPSGGIATYAFGLGNPQGLAFNSSGTLFIADINNGEVYQIAAGGGFVTPFAALPGCTDIAVNAAGEVFVSTNGSVERYSPAGVDLGQYGSVPSASGLAFDSLGNLLVSLSTPTGGGTTVDAIAPGSRTVSTYATGFSGPLFIATIPEPATIGLVACVFSCMLARSRR
jgi:sugar lactone lactonase YvrE